MPSAKIAGKLPKGDRDGLNPIAEIIADRPGERRLFIVVMHAARVEHDVEADEDTLHMSIDQVELVDRDADYIDAAMIREIMLRAQQRRNGRKILPFELRRNLEDLFPHLVTDDEREEREDDKLSSAERLRRHLEKVHGYGTAGRPSARPMTDLEAAEAHRDDHENHEINHPTSFAGWRRVDLVDLPLYLLTFRTAEASWVLLDRSGRASATVELEQTEVDKARTWAAERIEAFTRREVIRWHNSEEVDGGWVPVIDDQVQKPAESVPAEDQPTLDSLLPTGADSAASDTAGRTDGGDSPGATPADDDAEPEAPASDAATDESIPAAVFSAPEEAGPVDLDADTRPKTRARRGAK